MVFAHDVYLDVILTKGDTMRTGTRDVVRTDYLHAIKDVSAVLLAGPSDGSAGIPVPSRRQETRVAEGRICTYELCESIDEETIVIQQGEMYSLNRSPQGILLLMGCAPRREQLIEVHIPESRWRRSLNLYEVLWTKSVRIESCGDLVFVGCRLVFGPSRYCAL